MHDGKPRQVQEQLVLKKINQCLALKYLMLKLVLQSFLDLIMTEVQILHLT